MTFTSYSFLFFVLTLVILCYILPAYCKTAVLFFASILFIYLGGGVRTLVFLGMTIVVNYGAALKMEQRRLEKKSTKALYLTALVINLLPLIGFKYINFPGYTIDGIRNFMGMESSWTAIEILAPLGISFYTMQQISYITDVYWEISRAEKSLIRYGLFAGFFPQMLTGPIGKYEILSKTLFSQRKINREDLVYGVQRILWGLFKKLIISERLAVLVNAVYDDYTSYQGSFLVLAFICFAFQLYTDFSGAIDIAAGVARLFGVRLAENFRQPFFSRSDAEFWRRWHMTLGGWFKEYMMYPLLTTEPFRKLLKWGKKTFGKKQGKKVPNCLALLIIWFLLGLWHGGKWTFIIGSGLWHACLMIMAEAMENPVKKFYKKTGLNPENRLWVLFQRIRTFILVSIGFVFFRSDTVGMAADILKGMLVPDMSLFHSENYLALGLGVSDTVVLLAGLGVLLVVSVWKEKQENSYAQGKVVFISAALFFLVLIFGFYGQGYDPAAFIYSNF